MEKIVYQMKKLHKTLFKKYDLDLENIAKIALPFSRFVSISILVMSIFLIDLKIYF